MIVKELIAIIFAITFALLANAQPGIKSLVDGNNSYQKKKFDEAATHFNQALKANPADSIALFNLGNTYYRLGKPDEARKNWNDLMKRSSDADLLSRIDYNDGVALTRQKKLEESIEAYKNSLRFNPDDNEARENLQKALLELRKKNPPKQQDKKQQKQSSPKMDPQDMRNRLQQLEQKEKDVQQRLQNEKSKTAGSQAKDW